MALTRMLAGNGHETTVWSALEKEVEEFSRTRRQPNLPGMVIPESVRFTKDIAEVCREKDILLFAVPSVFVRATARTAAPYIPDVQIIGILVGSGETDQQIRDYLESKNLSYPVLLDTDGTVAAAYYVQAYPWSWVISKSYRPLGYVPGAVDLDTLHTVLESAKTEE
ncbi:MAG: redoxin domain-containing protein, partial [Erysipelotrichaceae bacterium]|nr:redoxin domain-containing protein [Erysipelotrichaceae bacterium]